MDNMCCNNAPVYYNYAYGVKIVELISKEKKTESGMKCTLLCAIRVMCSIIL